MPEHHLRVPRELAANLRYRKRVRERAATDEAFRRSVLTACKQDVLYWMMAFCWVYEPREDESDVDRSKILPFIPWSHQIPFILEVRKHLGFRDLGVEKSRGEGASWMFVKFAVHDFIFKRMSSIGIVSKDEVTADDAKNPDSIGWKVDFLLSMMPPWMVSAKDVDRNQTKHTWSNKKSGSSISAFACSQDVGSGGRKSWFLMDELAKFQHGNDGTAITSTTAVTNSRAFVSTPKGIDNEYAALMKEESNLVKLVLDWRDNETRNRGLYKFMDGLPVAVDPSRNPLPKEYDPPTKETLNLLSVLRRKGYTLEDKLRSPWYDKECNRPRMTPQRIAQEYDRDYGGSASRVFLDGFNKSATAHIRAPDHCGHWRFNPETLKGSFDEGEDGSVLLWTRLGVDKIPAKRPYAMGVDLSWGTGGSYSNNSVLEIIDLVTMEQVLEFASNTIAPVPFADLCVSIARWFHTCFMAWEHMGPGHQFTKRVLELNYPRVYRRTVSESSTSGRHKKTKEVGWSGLKQEIREAMFNGLALGVETGELKIHSRLLLEECGQYVYENGKIVHAGSQRSEDGAAKGKAHGDRVVAMGVAFVGAKDVESQRPLTISGEVPQHDLPNTWAARDKFHAAMAASEDDWDDRDNSDLAKGKNYR